MSSSTVQRHWQAQRRRGYTRLSQLGSRGERERIFSPPASTVVPVPPSSHVWRNPMRWRRRPNSKAPGGVLPAISAGSGDNPQPAAALHELVRYPQSATIPILILVIFWVVEKFIIFPKVNIHGVLAKGYNL
uniref:Uncharacterized protein n=1 Tax=Oryza sativa subsp. japonica TaxID=39947 RepID=Q2HPH5_ORYSJ|nr:hypothetical protein [Oryza sativa Japonica Group]